MPWRHLFAGIVNKEDAIIEGLRLAFFLDLNLGPVDGAASEEPPLLRRGAVMAETETGMTSERAS